MRESGGFRICAFVYGWYQHFVPPYVFSILHSYPHYGVRILCRDALDPAVESALGRIREEVSGNFEVIPGFMPHLRGRCYGIRWLLGRDHFEGCAYGWIGDVDVIHYREEPSWLSQEIERARLIGKPYANVTRSAEGHRNKLTGLSHFIVVEPYFERMQAIIDACLADPEIVRPDGTPGREIGLPGHSRGSLSVPSTGSDEFLLYHIVKQGCGVLEWNEERPYRHVPLHGLHLGTARIGKPWPEWTRRRPGLLEGVQRVLRDERFPGVAADLDERVRGCLEAAARLCEEA